MMCGKLLHVCGWADSQPHLPKALEIHHVFESCADMASRLSGPDHVAEVSGRMVEGIRVPLWEHNDSFLAWLAFTIDRRKPASIHHIIFRKRRPHRRSEAQELRRFKSAGA